MTSEELPDEGAEEAADELAGTLVIHRASWWEDVLDGVRLAGILGVLILPVVGGCLQLAGAAKVVQPFRAALLSFFAGLAAYLLRGKVRSQVILDPDDAVIHDAVWLFGKVYQQTSLAFDWVQDLTLARRVSGHVRAATCGDAEAVKEPRYEHRIEVRDRDGALYPLSDWVEVDEEAHGYWWRLTDALRVVSGMLDLPVGERDCVETDGVDLIRGLIWLVSMALTASAVVVVAG